MKRRATQPSIEQRTGPRAKPPVYPFTAIVGQEEMKLALLLNVIDPMIGGVLVMGHRGTGKSTAVRALADLLPEMTCVRECPYKCDPADVAGLCDECAGLLAVEGKLARERVSVPVVDLPLGATEDRVCGTINLERALKEGVKAFEPGLLARANRGFLYIDEVNLLEDHLIDLLLDVAVTGRHTVEREGISLEHPARFVLVGSGNPEEGELRPQLLDRFGLHVEVRTNADLDERVRIVEQREEFDRDPEAFRAALEAEQASMRRRISRARQKVHAVKLSSALLRRIAELCQQLKVDGHRADLTIARAARALSAFEGRSAVSEEDVRRVATMALRHRLRRDPLDQTSGGSRIEREQDKIFPPPSDAEENKDQRDGQNGSRPARSLKPKDEDGSNGAGRGSKGGANAPGEAAEQSTPPALDSLLTEQSFHSSAPSRVKQTLRTASARRSSKEGRATEDARRGRYVRATSLKVPGARVALDATLRATLLEGGGLNAFPSPQYALRYKRFKRKAGTLFIFAVDTSGSMALNRIAQAKGALARLLQQSYVRRDRVALVSFRAQSAELRLVPSSSVTRARRVLDELSIGGATPVAAGLACALEVIVRAAREGTERIVLLLFTDGRANVPLGTCEALEPAARRRLIEEELRWLGALIRQKGVELVVVDTQNRFTSGGEAQKLAELAGAHYTQLESAIERGL